MTDTNKKLTIKQKTYKAKAKFDGKEYDCSVEIEKKDEINFSQGKAKLQVKIIYEKDSAKKTWTGQAEIEDVTGYFNQAAKFTNDLEVTFGSDSSTTKIEVKNKEISVEGFTWIGITSMIVLAIVLLGGFAYLLRMFGVWGKDEEELEE